MPISNPYIVLASLKLDDSSGHGSNVVTDKCPCSLTSIHLIMQELFTVLLQVLMDRSCAPQLKINHSKSLMLLILVRLEILFNPLNNATQ